MDSLASKIHASFDLNSLVLLRVFPFLFFLAGLARHGGSRWCFQFLSSILNCFLELSVLRVNEVDSSQYSSIIEFRFFIGPFLPLLQLSISSQFRPVFRTKMIWPGCQLLSCQSPPGPHISDWRFSSNKRN